MIRSLNRVLKFLNLRIVKLDYYDSLTRDHHIYHSSFLVQEKLELLNRTEHLSFSRDTVQYSKTSSAQFGQDVWILGVFGSKHSGFFVEIGANNGFDLSNTLLLEKLGWDGILVEANPTITFGARKAKFVRRAVTGKTGDIVLLDVTKESMFSKLSEVPVSMPQHSEVVERFMIQTISLQDLLKEFHAPQVIEYISIDIEGGELDLLQNFDFSSFNVLAWSIETISAESLNSISGLMSGNGYKMVQLAHGVDAWFLKEGLLSHGQNSNQW